MKVDWYRLLVDLQMTCGLSMYDIAERTGIPRGTLRGYKELEAEPSHFYGQKLIVLWQQEMLPTLPIKK